ncbi:hypothetical protein LCGC14_2077560 [marine sediment metagenome]|uniref:Uncharacterized protein n=1 Tax=marine sediment metagenome TaxID=412755 RepID=A0A0F9EGR7_9ZZZZ
MNETVNLAAPWMQLGFAGLSVVLLAIIVWLIRMIRTLIVQLLGILDQNNQIIAANTHAITELRKTTAEELKLIRDLRDKMLQRPCLSDRIHEP